MDAKIQMKYVESKNQLADIPTKGSITRNEWHNLWHLFNIINDTTFSCSHFYSHTFLSAGKQSEMSQRSQEISSPGSTTAKARACCLVSRQCVSVGQVYSSDPESPRTTRDSQVWTWEERFSKSRLYSVQHASGNREYGYGSEVSGGLSETHASGNRECTRKVVQNMKDRLRHDESCSDISMNSWEDGHFDMDEIYGFIDAGSIAHGPELRKEFGFFKNSEFESIKRLVRDYRNDNRMKFRNWECIYTRFCDFTLGKTVMLKEQAIKWTRARVFVYSDSVLCLGKMHDPEDAIKKWIPLRELQGLDGEPIDFEWKIFLGATALNILQNSSRPTRESTSHLKTSVTE